MTHGLIQVLYDALPELHSTEAAAAGALPIHFAMYDFTVAQRIQNMGECLSHL